MNVAKVNRNDRFFRVLQTSAKTQTATMILAPGKSSGKKGNDHPRCEQVLIVLEGEVLAEIGDQKQTLRKGDVVIVPRGTPHRFKNCSQSPTITFNVYSPPAYDSDEAD